MPLPRMHPPALGVLALLVACTTEATRGGPDPDADGDGFPASVDCDDGNPAIHPAAIEVCDPHGIDEDCNGLVDDLDPGLDETTATRFHADQDGDGFGDPHRSGLSCRQPEGFVVDASDCDDNAPETHPAGREVCDVLGADEDCDGLVNEDDPSVDASALLDLYRDADGDGFGDPDQVRQACSAEPGEVDITLDCDDTDPSIHPAAVEICDATGIDEDCDLLSNDADPSLDLSTATGWFRDADGDGHGDAGQRVEACEAPLGHVSDPSDCDDTDAGINPLAQEVCDGGDVDEDCDGLADDADPSVTTSSMTSFHVDGDGDGHGDPSATVLACDLPTGAVEDASDCNDTDASIHPGASEICDDGGVDEDCDGQADDADPSVDPSTASLWYADGDLDGYGDPATGVLACAAPPSHVDDATDCNDGDPDTNPGASEVCNGNDDDCDGSIPADEIDADGDDCSTCEGDTDDGDAVVACATQVEVGSPASMFARHNVVYGNIYEITSTAVLESFTMNVDIASGCDVDFFVHRSTNRSGPWTLMWNGTTRSTGSASDPSSGLIDYTLYTGFHYALSAGWTCTAAAWYDTSGPSTSLPFGEVAGYASDVGYSGAFPALTSSGTSRTFHQRLTID